MSTTFTYDPRATTISDVTRVRFHTGQTVEDESLISDEDIEMAVSEGGSWQAAVIACLLLIIARLSKPTFRADWMQVDHQPAIKAFREMLTTKRREFGIPAMAASVVHVYRPDSLATEAPDYAAGDDD